MNSSNSPNRRRRVVRAASFGGVVTVAAATAFMAAPDAMAGTVSVNYGNCVSNDSPTVPTPANSTQQVTLALSSATATVGQKVTITWTDSPSVAPQSIPANAANAQADIVVGGAASSTILAGPSADLPATTAGATFNIPPFTATFTPTVAGNYTFTPGNNQENITLLGPSVNIQCTASGATVAATLTVTAATPGGGTSTTTTKPVGGTTTTTSGSSGGGGATTTATSAPAGAGSSATTSAAAGSGGGAGASATSATTAAGVLPHTGFDGTQLFEVAGAAAILGAGSLFLSRKRRGTRV